MKRILLFSGIILIGCRSSPETSFDNLTKAFISWYFKYNPIESSRYNISDNHGEYILHEKSGRDEYYADISRFIIELSQIDATKIPPEDRVDYNILYSQLEKMQYIMGNIRPWEWNPLWTIDEINDGMYILCEGDGFIMDKRVESVLSLLKKIPYILDQSKSAMIAYSELHISYANDRIDKLVNLLQQLPLMLNSDNRTLDKIDLLINNSVQALYEYKSWLNEDIKELNKIDFPLDIELIPRSFSYYTGGKYMMEPVYKLAEKKLIPTQNRLFNLVLPIYLSENDEPVWLDRDDTLEVISWTINSLGENYENQIGNSEILSQFYESITAIEQFISNKSLMIKKKNRSIQLKFAPSYNTSISPIFLFDHYLYDIDIDIKYNIYPPDEEIGYYIFTKQEIDIINAKNIVPGYGTMVAYAQSHPSMIRYLFHDPITVAGWKAYAVKMLIDEGFGNWDDEYHILKLKEEISIIVSAILESRYYNGEIKRKDAKEYYMKMAFMNKNEVEIIQMKSDLHYFSGTQSFIGLMEINSLLNEYKRKHTDEFKLTNFHSLLLNKGVMPLFELKKRILSL